MKRPIALLIVNAVVAVVSTLALIRWLAPQLLGYPIDLQVVQLDEKLPPFYDGVFEDRHRVRNDPFTAHRMRRLVSENAEEGGPFDLLGFRNRSVPIVADVVTIGDSQTVGRNSTIDWSWPSRLAWILRDKAPVVYNMSTGGWGPVQYLYMFEKAVSFRPRVAIVAFYTGNDAPDAIKLAYNFEAWKSLRASAVKPQSPPLDWPAKESEMWAVSFRDGSRMQLTPKARLSANDRAYPATLDGYRIMADVGRRIGSKARHAGVLVVFTIIPTKELVYAARISKEGIKEPESYAKLVAGEAQNIDQLAGALGAVRGATYVDLVRPLQDAALSGEPLYPAGSNGHPIDAGYDRIARTLAPVVNELLPEPPHDGLIKLKEHGQRGGSWALVKDGSLWRFANEGLMVANGWQPHSDEAAVVGLRDVAHLVDRGEITSVAPAEFGPLAVRARKAAGSREPADAMPPAGTGSPG